MWALLPTVIARGTRRSAMMLRIAFITPPEAGSFLHGRKPGG